MMDISYFLRSLSSKFFQNQPRRLSENSNFFQNRGMPKKNYHRHRVDIPRIIFLGMTKSLGKRAFSDSLLAKTAIDKGIIQPDEDLLYPKFYISSNPIPGGLRHYTCCFTNLLKNARFSLNRSGLIKSSEPNRHWRALSAGISGSQGSNF